MPMPTMKTHGRLAALGALGVSAGAFALWFLFYYISRRTPTGGMDYEHTAITRVSTGVLFLAFIAVHVVFARQLLHYVRTNRSSE